MYPAKEREPRIELHADGHVSDGTFMYRLSGNQKYENKGVSYSRFGPHWPGETTFDDKFSMKPSIRAIDFEFSGKEL